MVVYCLFFETMRLYSHLYPHGVTYFSCRSGHQSPPWPLSYNSITVLLSTCLQISFHGSVHTVPDFLFQNFSAGSNVWQTKFFDTIFHPLHFCRSFTSISFTSELKLCTLLLEFVARTAQTASEFITRHWQSTERKVIDLMTVSRYIIKRYDGILLNKKWM